MFTIENHAGRLVEFIIRSPIDEAELAAFYARTRAVLGALQGRAVLCTNLQGARIFTPPVADGFLSVMRADNKKIERSGFLVAENAVFAMQVERLIRQADNPIRRVFHEAAELRAWLGEVLTEPEERRRLGVFLQGA